MIQYILKLLNKTNVIIQVLDLLFIIKIIEH